MKGKFMPTNSDIKKVKRGAIPTPRHLLAAAMPHSPILNPPTTYIWPYGKISIWGNDNNGDCSTAEEAFTKSCDPNVFIDDSIVIAWAQTNNFLNGATLVDVMTSMQKSGFVDGKTYDDGNYSSVNWTDPVNLKSAIYHGPVKIGVAADQLETTCGNHGFGNSGWVATGYNQDNNEDHCVCLCGYGDMNWLAQQLNAMIPDGVDGTVMGYAMFTWGSVGIIDEPSMLAITQEAWLRSPTSVIV
jgi:hypothetical protein